MKITVYEKIMSGNLFDESECDERASADKLAALCQREFTEILKQEYPDAEIQVKVESEHYSSGHNPGLQVTIEGGGDAEAVKKIDARIRSLLRSDDIWENRADEWTIQKY